MVCNAAKSKMALNDVCRQADASAEKISAKCSFAMKGIYLSDYTQTVEQAIQRAELGVYYPIPEQAEYYPGQAQGKINKVRPMLRPMKFSTSSSAKNKPNRVGTATTMAANLRLISTASRTGGC